VFRNTKQGGKIRRKSKKVISVKSEDGFLWRVRELGSGRVPRPTGELARFYFLA